MTRKLLLNISLTCFISLALSAHATQPDGKAIDECIEQSYSASAFRKGAASFLLNLVTTNMLNKAAGQKVIDQERKLNAAKNAAQDAADAAATEDYLEHYASCMRRHPEWQIESTITRRDFLKESEKPIATDNSVAVIDSFTGKTEVGLGETNIITAKFRLHALNKQDGKLMIYPRLIRTEAGEYGPKSIKEFPFPGNPGEILDLIDGVYTYRFGITVPPENEKTLPMKGEELICDMMIMQSSKKTLLLDRKAFLFRLKESKKETVKLKRLKNEKRS